MALSCAPITQQEEDELSVWAEGTYGFTLKLIENVTSKKSGKIMQKVELLFSDFNRSTKIWDYLGGGSDAHPMMKKKLKDLCGAIGITAEYEQFKQNPHEFPLQEEYFLDKKGEAELVIEIGDDGIKRNKVKYYILKQSGHQNTLPKSTNNDIDDDIPF